MMFWASFLFLLLVGTAFATDSSCPTGQYEIDGACQDCHQFLDETDVEAASCTFCFGPSAAECRNATCAEQYEGYRSGSCTEKQCPPYEGWGEGFSETGGCSEGIQLGLRTNRNCTLICADLYHIDGWIEGEQPRLLECRAHVFTGEAELRAPSMSCVACEAWCDGECNPNSGECYLCTAPYNYDMAISSSDASRTMKENLCWAKWKIGDLQLSLIGGGILLLCCGCCWRSHIANKREARQHELEVVKVKAMAASVKRATRGVISASDAKAKKKRDAKRARRKKQEERYLSERSGETGARAKLDEYRAAFDIFDVDGDGTITKAELNIAMVKLGQDPTAKDMEKLFNEADVDGSGSIEFPEFLLMMMKKEKQKKDKRRRERNKARGVTRAGVKMHVRGERARARVKKKKKAARRLRQNYMD